MPIDRNFVPVESERGVGGWKQTFDNIGRQMNFLASET